MENFDKEIMDMGKKLEKKVFEVTDEEIEQVSGGFGETNSNLPTYGFEVKCPKCQATGASNFAAGAWKDSKQNTVEYHCNCGCEFVVNSKGYAVMKKDWIALCVKKGYKYPFA